MAVDYARTAMQVAFSLEVKSPKIFEHIFLNNGCLAMFGSKSRVKVHSGGNRFDERVHLGQNSNVDHRSKYAEIATNYQNNFLTAYYGQSVCSGSTPINMVDIDQNGGNKKLSDLSSELRDELANTFANKVSDALEAESASETAPISIRETLEATAFGSQTSTLGGISRADHAGTDPTDAWQTRYSASGADLSGSAGIGTATRFLYTCSEGSAKNNMPDLILTTNGVFAQASGAADVLRRYTVNEKMIKFGHNNIMIGNATLITDRNVPTGHMQYLNTNYAHVQVLGGPNTKKTGSVTVIGDGAVSVPVNICKPVESDSFLVWVIKAYMTYNLTFGGLKYHGLLAGCAEATE